MSGTSDPMTRDRVGPMAVAVALVVVLGACSWTQFRADPGHSGNQPLEVKIGATNVSTLTQAWSASSSNRESSPTVANGVVYVSWEGGLGAWDAKGSTNCAGAPKRCAPLWTAALGTGTPNYGPDIYSSPAVANGTVYVGSVDGNVYAFDAAGVTGCSGVPKTCAPLWTAFTGGVGYGGVRSSPTVVDGTVYVGAQDGNVYAFDAAGTTGCSGVPKRCTPLWVTFTGSALNYSSPAVAGGVVYSGSAAGVLLALDARTGTVLWTSTGDSTNYTSSPAVVNGTVYFSVAGGLAAFDAAGERNCSGSPRRCTALWYAGTDTAAVSSPAVANGVVYVGSGNGKLHAFDATTGTSKWTAPAANLGPLSAPAIANGVVYIGGSYFMYAFDAAGVAHCSGTPKTCAPLWYSDPSAGSGFFAVSSPAVADGVVYVGSEDGNLHAFALPA